METRTTPAIAASQNLSLLRRTQVQHIRQLVANAADQLCVRRHERRHLFHDANERDGMRPRAQCPRKELFRELLSPATHGTQSGTVLPRTVELGLSIYLSIGQTIYLSDGAAKHRTQSRHLEVLLEAFD